MFTGKAWRASEFGAPKDVLKLEATTWAKPSLGDVLVEVHASGLALPDLLMTRGGYPLVSKPPVTPGQEVSGVVVAAPEGSAFSVGEPIMGITRYSAGSGGCAEYALVEERYALPKPAELSHEEAAGFVISYRTAYAALVERANLTSGQTLLVLGAGGSSGAAAIDLGKALGAVVIAAVGSQEKLDFCKRAGANHAINYRTQSVPEFVLQVTDGHGADVIFDPVGGASATSSLQAIARHGRVAIIGYASGDWIKLNPLDMVLRSYSAVGVFAGGFTPEEDRRAYAVLREMAGKEVRTSVGRIFNFDEVAEAISLLEEDAPAGKLIVRVRF